jgi:hypothetical protein
MKRASMTKTKVPATSDDPRSGHGHEDRDAMNDRTKQQHGSLASAPAKEQATTPPPERAWGQDTTTDRKKPRSRESEHLTWLGQSLRQSYEETLNEPVPESFGALLDRLEQEDEDKQAR